MDTSYDFFPQFDNSKIYTEDIYGAIEGAVSSLVVGFVTGGIGWFGIGVAVEFGATVASAREGIRQGLQQMRNNGGGQ